MNYDEDDSAPGKRSKAPLLIAGSLVVGSLSILLLVLWLQKRPHLQSMLASTKSTELTIDANDLWFAYQDNEARADRLYTGKRIEVVGIYHGRPELNKPHKDRHGHWLFTFYRTGSFQGGLGNPPEHWWWGHWDAPPIVVVHFRDSEVDKLATLHSDYGLKGSGALTIQGVCRGLDKETVGESSTAAVSINDAVVVREAK